MSHKPTPLSPPFGPKDQDALIALLAKGYSDDVRTFTKGFQTNQSAVLSFELLFDHLVMQGLINWEETASQEAVFARAAENADELEVFLAEMSRPYETYLRMLNHGHEITVETGWHDAIAGKVVWDRWTVEVDDPVIAYAITAFQFDACSYDCAAKPTEKPLPPMYRYHPERFRAYRDYAELVGKLYRQRVDPASGLLTLDQLNQVMQHVNGEANRRSMGFPRKHKEGHPSPSLVMEAENSLSTAYGRFVQTGRQIMDFPPGLTEMLAETDIDDIPLNSIKLPFASQFLYFGPQPNLEIEPGWFVDGAYVEQRGSPGDLRFTVTAAPSDQGLSAQWYLFPEVEYTQDFVGEYRSMDLATAIDTVLSNQLAELARRRADRGGDITSTLQAAAGDAGIEFPEDVQIINAGPTLAVHRDGATRRRHPIYKAALQLVVNALCYIAAYPDDIDTVWPEGTPDSLKQQALNGGGKAQQRAKSKLTALGYVPVHICGKRIAEQRIQLGVPTQTHGNVSTHWRRGHWRNQVHGPSRSLRKLIWVMPVVVGSKQAAEPESGHLYLVS